MSDQVTVTLPPAPPGAYLRWMAYWREVEQQVAERKALLDVASQESAPFVGDEVADFLSADLVRAITTQAIEAQRSGQPEVAPRLTARRDLLQQGIEYVRLRGRWLQEHKVAEAVGIDPLEPELVHLRSEVLASVREALSSEAERG